MCQPSFPSFTSPANQRGKRITAQRFLPFTPAPGKKKLEKTYIIVLLQDGSALAVTDDGPVDPGVSELLNADLTGESTIGLVEDVLGRDGELGVGELAHKKEVEGWRGNDDLSVGVDLGGVEVGDDGGEGLGNAVPGLLSDTAEKEYEVMVV